MKDPKTTESAASAETLPVPATRAQVPARVEAEEPAATTGPEWLGTTEAARRLGITTRTLYRFIDQGKLAAYRFGRVIRLKQGDVDTYIESCRIAPGTIAHLYPD